MRRVSLQLNGVRKTWMARRVLAPYSASTTVAPHPLNLSVEPRLRGLSSSCPHLTVKQLVGQANWLPVVSPHECALYPAKRPEVSELFIGSCRPQKLTFPQVEECPRDPLSTSRILDRLFLRPLVLRMLLDLGQVLRLAEADRPPSALISHVNAVPRNLARPTVLVKAFALVQAQLFPPRRDLAKVLLRRGAVLLGDSELVRKWPRSQPDLGTSSAYGGSVCSDSNHVGGRWKSVAREPLGRDAGARWPRVGPAWGDRSRVPSSAWKTELWKRTVAGVDAGASRSRDRLLRGVADGVGRRVET